MIALTVARLGALPTAATVGRPSEAARLAAASVLIQLAAGSESVRRCAPGPACKYRTQQYAPGAPSAAATPVAMPPLPSKGVASCHNPGCVL